MEFQVAIPQINKTETEKFAKQWTYNGIIVSLDNTSIQFATDWANLLLKQFVLTMAQQAQAQQQNIPQQATKEVSPLILES